MTTNSTRTTDSIDGLVGQVVDEFLAQLAAGQRPDVEEFAERNPEIADLVREIFPALRFVRDPAADGAVPRPKGDGIDRSRSRELGDFHILRELGRGGMGVVYEAEQLSMGRKVALKVLPFAAMIDAKAFQRFQNEVRAAATLDHDHITAVYSVGEERGVHYYAMQLVRGQSLAAVLVELSSNKRQTPLPGSVLSDVVICLSQNSVDVDEPTLTRCRADVSTEGRRLPRSNASPAYFQAIARLGIQAAQALQHAHENGIVHRDIKPGNLLLDTSGKLWLTDFGLARLEAEAGVTMTGDIVGTLRYMSPEQVLAKRVMVDHRADIYSLGATLYEMLTLQPAFDADDRAELLRKIAFEEPRPLRQIDGGIPRELETIVSCSLSKNPGERYDSAEALAADLQAFLENRSIRARRPTVWQRATKWCQRHKPLVATSVLLLVISTIGLAVSNYLIADQQKQTEIALGQMRKQRDDADRQRQEATNQRNEADRQRAVAEENFQRALQTVDRYLTQVSENELLNKPSLQPLRKDLLELALKYYQEFVAERSNDPELRKELADAYERVGKITRQIGTTEDALRAFRQALQIREQLLAEHADHFDQLDLARSKWWVAVILRETGQTDEAAEFFRQAIAIAESLVEQYPDSPEYQSSLSRFYISFAKIYRSKGQLEDAVKLSRQAIDIQAALVTKHPDVSNYKTDLAFSYNYLAQRWTDLGRDNEAIPIYRKTIEIREKLVEQIPDGLKHQLAVANSCRDLAIVYTRTGELDEAATLCAKAIQIHENLAAQNPDTHEFQHELARTNLSYAGLLTEQGKNDEAASTLKKAVEILTALVEQDPQVLKYQRMLAAAYNNLALEYSHLGENEKVVSTFRNAIEIVEPLVEANPHRPYFQLFLAGFYGNLGLSYVDQGRDHEAITPFRRSIEILEMLVEQHPDIPKYQSTLGDSYNNHAAHFVRLGLIPQAIAMYEKSMETHRKLIEEYHEDPNHQIDLAFVYTNSARLYLALGRGVEAVARCRLAIEIIERPDIVNRVPATKVAGYYVLLGRAEQAAGNSQQASEAWQKAVKLIEAIPQADRTDSDWGYLSQALCHLQRWDEARAALQTALHLRDETSPTVKSGPLWWLLTIALHHLGETEQAREYYDQLAAEVDATKNPHPSQVLLRDKLAELLGIEDE